MSTWYIVTYCLPCRNVRQSVRLLAVDASDAKAYLLDRYPEALWVEVSQVTI